MEQTAGSAIQHNAINKQDCTVLIHEWTVRGVMVSHALNL